MATPDLPPLSPEQQLALQQFTSVTDSPSTTAIPLLQKCQWNAQIAITRFFDGDSETIDPVAEAARSQPQPPPPPQAGSRRAETLMDNIPRSSRTRRSNDGLDEAPRVVPTPESQLSRAVPFPFSVILLPFNLTYTLFQRLFSFAGYLFPFLPRLLSRLYSGRTSQPSRDSGRRPLNPRDTAARFMREFEEEYGVTHSTVPFHEGGYAQAFDLAKRELKFLMVVLLSPEHDDTAAFVRETLLSPEVLTFVKDAKNEIVVWAGTVQDAEAYQVATALGVTKFPYACLIVHTPKVSSTSMSRIATSTGPTTAAELLAKFQAAMQKQGSELARIRAQRMEQEASRSLRQDQESAYERSLAQDREKARRKREEEAEKEKSEREERERGEVKAEAKRRVELWRRWRARGIGAEPGTEVKDAVRISLRMVDGERVVRRFSPEAELEELYAFVECYDLLHGDQEEVTEEKSVEEPEGYEHVYKFRLVSPMPREVYDLEKGGRIRDRIGRSGNLIVERVVGEDDEDEEDDEDDEDDEGSLSSFRIRLVEKAMFEREQSLPEPGKMVCTMRSRTESDVSGKYNDRTSTGTMKADDGWKRDVYIVYIMYIGAWSGSCLVVISKPRSLLTRS
ncbi:UBX domain-containing protein 10 [Elasticomyces elasticus]|nr:UBX domain-containing protein 10 [Elasticomyces elasticus]KAK3660082.1 UBX domain-containing protein 10 [Elasticomyces elasticus]KAK4911083.1 UBX domain-containing protein 10 [Elasticomyces elasticus]